MKRSREPEPPARRVHPGMPPGGAGGPPRLPPSHLGGPMTPAAAAAAQAQAKLTTNDALSYLREVKNRFADRKQVYDTFLDIMKEFKAQRIDTSGVIVRVKQLFKGHRELILGFNTFLPKGYEIELARISDDEEEEEAAPAQPQQAQPPPPQAMQPAQPQQAANAAAAAGAPKQAVEFDQAINYVNKIKNRFASDERVYKAFLEILNMYRKGQKNIHQVYTEVAVLFANHDDLLHEFTYFLPDAQGQASAQMRSMIRNPNLAGPPMGMGGRMPGMVGGVRPGMGVPMRGGPMGPMGMGMQQPGSPTDHSRNMHKRKAARRAEEGFRRLDDPEDGYGAGMRVGRGSLAKEVQFLERVKGRLRSREQYGDFLKCLNLYSQDIITRGELVGLVADILGRTPDLMSQFHVFMSGCEAIDLADLPVPGQRGVGGPPMSNRDLLKAKLQKDKFMTKPLSEIVANETERITPSYVKMPPGYPKLAQSGRTPLGDEVLNDQYVNVITGSEDYSFKLMRKNQYEEALFRCEDDRYEFDIAMEQNLSAIRVFKPVADKLAKMSPEDRAQFSWADMPRVSRVHLGHVQRLYGDSGLQLVDMLQKNPAVAVPVVLQRLQAKDQEWRKVKEEMIPVWKKIYEQNYPRSLDHRSFYFKQAEKKCMMAKVMVAEIKDAADKRRAEEHNLRGLSMAYKHRIPATAAPVPDLQFAYADRAVFEDVYLALQTAIEHQLHPGIKEQALLLYLQVIEPFLGLPPREDELNRIREQAEDDGGKDGDVDMTDIKSDSSEQDAAANGGAGEEVVGPSAAGKGTPAPEGTPEPGTGDEKPQGSGEGTGATDAEQDEEGGDVAGGRRRGSSADGSTDGEAGGRVYAHCKPIMPRTGPAQAPTPAQPEPQGPNAAPVAPPTQHPMPAPGARLLFGNENMYVFFRYHRYLYDRLCSARKFSLEVATKKATQPQRGGGIALPTHDAVDGTRTPVPEPPSEAVIKEEAERVHASFLNCLKHMLSTSGYDIGAFEDQVRNLLGTNSYELFTLDKLLARLAKHLQLMVSEDSTSKLWEMFRYEQARGQPVTHTMYHINCHTVLDDTCYRIEYSDDDHTLRFQQGEAERSDGYLAPEASLPPYLVSFINSAPALAPGTNAVVSSSPEGGSRSRPQLFLHRNLPDSLNPRPGLPAPSPAQADAVLSAALGQVVVANGLETKIACTSCKVSYVLDTEDTMVRRKRVAGRKADVDPEEDVRTIKFDAWLRDRLRVAREEQEHKIDEEQLRINQALGAVAVAAAGLASGHGGGP